jgi:hypothetical protein
VLPLVLSRLLHEVRPAFNTGLVRVLYVSDLPGRRRRRFCAATHVPLMLLCLLSVPTVRYVQYISHNAYILVAVHDLSFCEGAKQAFELTMRNIGQVPPQEAGRFVVSFGCAVRSIQCLVS